MAAQTEAAARVGAAVVEFHTGHYCDLFLEGREDEAADDEVLEDEQY